MDTTDLDIHLALSCCASGGHNKIVHTVLAASLSKVGHALYGVIKNTESVTLAVWWQAFQCFGSSSVWQL